MPLNSGKLWASGVSGLSGFNLGDGVGRQPSRRKAGEIFFGPAIPGMNARAKTAPDESGWIGGARLDSPSPSPIHGALLFSQAIDRLASPFAGGSGRRSLA